MIDRVAWRRGFVVLLLLGAAAFFYLSYQHTGPVTGRNFTFVGVERIAADPSIPSPSQTLPGEDSPEAPELTAEDLVPVVSANVRVEPIAAGFFDAYRFERERAQALQLEQLRELLGARSSDTAGMEEELVRLLQRMEREVQLESLLRARGISEALVVLAEQGVIVVVSDELTQSEAAHIGDIVHRVAGVSLEHITISDGVVIR